MAENTQFKNIKPTGQGAPSQEKRKRRGAVSEYKKSLVEKQALKNIYGLSERQFKRYVKETKKKKLVFENLSGKLKKTETPLWLAIDKEKFDASVIGEPSLAEVNPPVQIPLVFEFYSR